MPSSSGNSLETRTTALPCVGELVDELVDFDLCADVDAAGRLVEKDDLRLGLQRFAEDDLLLVAAGEFAVIASRLGAFTWSSWKLAALRWCSRELSMSPPRVRPASDESERLKPIECSRIRP